MKKVILEMYEIKTEKYYSYSNDYDKDKKKDIRWPLRDAVKAIRTKTGVLKAVYNGSPFNLVQEPDIDNILLYNMRLATSGFQVISLLKIIESDRKITLYQYDIRDNCLLNNELESIKGAFPIDANIDGSNQEERRFGVTVFFYNKFRKWLNGHREIKHFPDSHLELIIEYRGSHSLSESSFIKHAVDGIISAMQRCDEDPERLRNYKIETCDPQLCIFNGDNVIRIHENKVIWNPQDHLVYKLVVIKNPGLECYLRIRIRAFNN